MVLHNRPLRPEAASTTLTGGGVLCPRGEGFMSELLKEKWVQWVALTTTVLAVCAAISALRASSYSTQATLTTTRESSAWAYFQSKSIKQHSCEVERDLVQALMLEAKNPETRGHLDPVLSTCLSDIQRYDKEKTEIRKQAEDFASQQDRFRRHSGIFSLAVMLFQISIMLSSVGALLKKQRLWYGGLVFGAAGLVYMVNGFFLLF